MIYKGVWLLPSVGNQTSNIDALIFLFFFFFNPNPTCPNSLLKMFWKI